MLTVKSKRVSKRNKKSWRKNIDHKDVDDFLEEKRLEERIGSFKDKKDEELFIIDREGSKTQLSKKQKACLPPKCLLNLEPCSAVPDPVIKRNRVRTKEEKKHPIRKKIEEAKRAQGIIPKQVLEAKKQRALTYARKKKQPKGLIFNKDVWTEEIKDSAKEALMEWLSKDTIRHNLTNTRQLKVPAPKGVLRKKSILPSIEKPHPGISYNPSYKDHQDLLNKIAEKEMNTEKEEAHILRVTSEMFAKVSPQEKQENWMKEMSEGLIKDEEEDDEEKPSLPLDEYKTVNPPTTLEKRKTAKQRRKQKEEKQAALLKKQLKVEKKKRADIYKLRFINKEVQEAEQLQTQIREKKTQNSLLKALEPKRLGKNKFAEPDLEFARGCDLKGNLRTAKPVGNLLADRFYSLQKRNILVPSIKRTSFKKAKVKKYTKASFKEVDEKLIIGKKQKKSLIKS